MKSRVMGLLPAVIAFGVTSAGCFLVVLYEMLREESASQAFLGLLFFPYAVVWCWRNRDDVEVGSFHLSAVMTVWIISTLAMAFYWLIMAPGG
jgi:hypothetical protein